jgi:hypothetical protein
MSEEDKMKHIEILRNVEGHHGRWKNK